jgi:hypothetical protein
MDIQIDSEDEYHVSFTLGQDVRSESRLLQDEKWKNAVADGRKHVSHREANTVRKQKAVASSLFIASLPYSTLFFSTAFTVCVCVCMCVFVCLLFPFDSYSTDSCEGVSPNNRTISHRAAVHETNQRETFFAF